MKKLLLIMLLVNMTYITPVYGTQLKYEQHSNTQLEKMMERAAKLFNINPNFLKALAYIETRKGEKKYRCGWIGKRTKKYPGTYCGPLAIHFYKYEQGFDITDPYINILIGANALRGVGSDPVAQKLRLKGKNGKGGYNATFTEGYWKAIKQAERMFARGEL